MQKNAAQSALQQIHNMHKEITCTSGISYTRVRLLNRRTPVRIRTQMQSNVERSQNQNLSLNHDPSEFSLLRDFVLYIFSLFDVVSSVSNPEVQSGAVITTSL